MRWIPSLKLTANAPENRPKRPKRKRESIPSIHFQVLLLLVSGSVICCMIYQYYFDFDMGVNPKIGVFTPQIIPFVHRVLEPLFSPSILGYGIPLFLG